MKALWFLIAAAAVSLLATWHLGYTAGQKWERQFAALCSSPGVRCVVEFTPQAVGEQLPGIEALPENVTGEWADNDGRMPAGCNPGDIAICADDRWDPRASDASGVWQ